MLLTNLAKHRLQLKNENKCNINMLSINSEGKFSFLVSIRLTFWLFVLSSLTSPSLLLSESSSFAICFWNSFIVLSSRASLRLDATTFSAQILRKRDTSCVCLDSSSSTPLYRSFSCEKMKGLC